MPNYRKPIPTPYREYSAPRCASAPGPGNFPPDPFALTMAYVPWQRFGQTMSAGEGLAHGTIFPELYKPLTCQSGNSGTASRTGGNGYGCR